MVCLLLCVNSSYSFFSNSKPVTPETEALARKAFKQAGIENSDTFPIYNMSGSFTAAISGGSSLLINEEKFNSLPENQKWFIFGHEAGHVLKNHFLKGLLWGIPVLAFSELVYVCSFFAYLSLYEKGLQKIKNKKLKKWVKSVSGLGAILSAAGTGAFVFLLLHVPVRWIYELEANHEGAKLLNAYQGGLDFLQAKENKYIQTIQTGSFWEKTHARFNRYFFDRLFHPPISWEQAALKKAMPAQ